MAEFVPITTQEEFDAAIGERLKRERETLQKKYGDYDVLKSKVADYEKQISDMTKAADEAAKKYEGYDQQMANLQEKIKGYETDSVKTRIALECGLPYAMAARLTGDGEEAIRKDAESLVKLFGGGRMKESVPMRSTEPAGTDTKRDALRALNARLNDND